MAAVAWPGALQGNPNQTTSHETWKYSSAKLIGKGIFCVPAAAAAAAVAAAGNAEISAGPPLHAAERLPAPALLPAEQPQPVCRCSKAAAWDCNLCIDAAQDCRLQDVPVKIAHCTHQVHMQFMGIDGKLSACTCTGRVHECSHMPLLYFMSHLSALEAPYLH
eukprot:scaffold108210_cov17-Tisochrysis_lutea.AAC.1